MCKKIFVILFILAFHSSFSQNISRTYAGSSGTDTKPNVLLKLKNDNTYDLQIFNENHTTWQFYNGKYRYENDSLILEYELLYTAPVCQLKDTFHHRRTINLLYTDADNKVVDTFSYEFNGNSINLEYFPVTYRNIVENSEGKDNQSFTFYVPDFEGDEMNILFYKPDRKIKEHFRKTLPAGSSYLVIDEKNKSFFAPFERLRLQ